MADLSIQLRTDYAPGEDFSSIELLVYRADKPWKRPQNLISSAPDGISRDSDTAVFYVRKVRKNRNNVVHMRLLDAHGAPIVHRTIQVKPTSRRKMVRFVIDRF